MILNMIAGGGAGLNLSVKAYASAESLPASTREGTVAVITDIQIANYIFSDLEPASKSKGTVWINTSGGSIAYPVDKNGVLTLYPAKCSVYDGSSWVLCDAHLYKYGKWSQFAARTYLFFDNGDQCVDVTGGWTKEGYTDGHSFGNTAEITNGQLRCATSSNYRSAILGTVKPVDLTAIDTLYFEIADSLNCGYSIVGVTKSPDNCQCNPVEPSEAGVNAEPTKNGASIVELDVSTLKGQYYIYVMSWKYDHYDAYTYVAKIWAGADTEGYVRTIEQSIPMNSTYRHCDALYTSDYVRVGSLGADLQGINYVGEGLDDYNAMMVPVSAFTFEGTFKRLSLALYLWTSSSENHTFRWAVTTSRDNENAYKSYGDVTDANQLAAGSFTPPYNGSFQWYTIEFTGCTVPSGTPLYIYLWRDNTIYGNLHVINNAVVTLQYEK